MNISSLKSNGTPRFPLEFRKWLKPLGHFPKALVPVWLFAKCCLSSFLPVGRQGVLSRDSPPPQPAAHTTFLSPQQTPEEELCNLLTNVLFSVTWRGVEGSAEAAWRERGQVFSVLTQLGASATLVRPPDCIKRR